MSVLNDIKIIFGKNKDENKTTADAKPPKKILIVEDDPILLEMYRDKLTHEGFKIISAQNGEEGLEKAISENPDGILLDLLMPVLDGKSMLYRLRKIPKFKKTPVIVLTNAGQVENIRETQTFNDAVEFLVKSNTNLDDIVTKMKRYVW